MSGLVDRLGSLAGRDNSILLQSPLLGIPTRSSSSSSIVDESVGPLKSRFVRFTRSKILISVALPLVILLLVISISSDASTTNAYASKLSTLHAEFADKLSKWKAPSASTTTIGDGLDRSWDYYAQHGVFVSGRENKTLPQSRRARFIPVGLIDQLAETGKTGLEGDLKLGDGFDDIGKFVAGVSHGQKSELDSLSWLQNKTVLLIGDSIDRFSLDFTCRTMLHGSGLTYRELHHEPHDLSYVSRAMNDLDEFSEPHKCTLPAEHFPNTSFWSLMVYGVTSDEEDWAHKPQAMHPRKYDGKIRMFAEKFAALGKKPDLIIVNTVLWDLATANLRDARAEIPSQEMLSWPFLKEFKEKTLDLMALISELWPDAAKMYRPNHAMSQNSDGVWFLHGLDPMPKAINRTPYAPNKVLQLNQIVDELLANQTGVAKPFWPFDLRHVTQEYILDFPDGVHTGNMGRTIYAQMLAYYIKMLT